MFVKHIIIYVILQLFTQQDLLIGLSTSTFPFSEYNLFSSDFSIFLVSTVLISLNLQLLSL